MATSDSSVIKEYAFQLGWNIDDQAFKNYQKILADTDASILLVGGSLAAVGLATVAFEEKMSSSMEKIYFATRRTGTTAAEWQQFGLAITNAGGSAEGAAASLQNLAAFLRDNPGGASWLEQHGVDPKNIGNAKKELDDLAARWKTMPWFEAKAEAKVVGIDDQTLLARLDPNYKEDDTFDKAYKLFGMNADKANDAAHAFQIQMRTMGADFTAFGQWLENDLNGPMEKFIKLTEGALQGLQKFILIAQDKGLAAAADDAVGGHNSIGAVAGAYASAIGTDIKAGYNLRSLEVDGQHDRDVQSGAATPYGVAGWAQMYGKITAFAGTKDPAANAKAKAAYDRLVADGIPSVQAAGMVGSSWMETGGTFDPTKLNTEGGGRGARGLFQIRGSRIDDFMKQYGHDPLAGTAQEQLDFAAMEVLRGKEKGNATHFMAAGDPGVAGRLFQNDIQRSNSDIANGRSESYAQHVAVTVNIHGNATADDVRKGVASGLTDAGVGHMTRQFQQ